MNNGVAIPEADLLIACLRGTLSVVPPDTDWRALTALAQTHGALPLVNRALTAKGVIVSDDEFGSAVVASRLSCERLAAELEQVLAHFARHGMEVVPLKGPVLAESLYGDVTLRPCIDLDLLVRVADYRRAEHLLTNEGWQASAPADDYQRKFVRDDLLMELHFGGSSPRSFPFDVDGAWSRARTSTFRGQPIMAMSQADRALYLLLHGLKHGYGRLIWVLDVARALETLQECSPRELANRASAQGLEQGLQIGCAMVDEVFPGRLSRELLSVLGESPDAMQAARGTVQRLLAGKAGTGRDPDIWSLYLQTEGSPTGRWRRRLAFFVPTNEDYRWTDGHRLPRFIAPFARPFRLLTKYGIRRAWRTAFPRIR